MSVRRRRKKKIRFH